MGRRLLLSPSDIAMASVALRDRMVLWVAADGVLSHLRRECVHPALMSFALWDDRRQVCRCCVPDADPAVFAAAVSPAARALCAVAAGVKFQVPRSELFAGVAGAGQVSGVDLGAVVAVAGVLLRHDVSAAAPGRLWAVDVSAADAAVSPSVGRLLDGDGVWVVAVSSDQFTVLTSDPGGCPGVVPFGFVERPVLSLALQLAAELDLVSAAGLGECVGVASRLL
jgi:hypothetical protein